MIMEMTLGFHTKIKSCDTMAVGKVVMFPLKYKEAIIEIVGKIQSEKSLKRIYKLVLYLYTHETDS